MTLTLAEVPPRMGGAAGGALQTGQRIGASIGAAVLVTVYQLAGDDSAGAGLRAALLTGAALVSLALVMAIAAALSGSRALRPTTALAAGSRMRRSEPACSRALATSDLPRDLVGELPEHLGVVAAGVHLVQDRPVVRGREHVGAPAARGASVAGLLRVGELVEPGAGDAHRRPRRRTGSGRSGRR